MIFSYFVEPSVSSKWSFRNEMLNIQNLICGYEKISSAYSPSPVDTLFFVRKAYVDLISWKFYLFTKARSHFSEENTETISSLTSYQELRRSEFLIGGYVGARALLLSAAP